MAKLVVLVVDSQDDTMERIAEHLRREGAHPVPARNVAEARVILDAIVVDAVVTHHAAVGEEVPGASGVTFLRELRAGAAHRELPVVMLSASASAEIALQAESLRAECVVPVDLRTMSRALFAATCTAKP